MKQHEAIKRILMAIAELQDYSTSQGPLEAASADEAITKLEEVIEAIQKHQLEYTPFAA
jgi:hypothetical protein